MLVKYVFQMTRNYDNIFNTTVLQNVPKIGISGLKRNHLATLLKKTSVAAEA
jgi:hypothetical protein